MTSFPLLQRSKDRAGLESMPSAENPLMLVLSFQTKSAVDASGTEFVLRMREGEVWPVIVGCPPVSPSRKAETGHPNQYNYNCS